jgi:hypothetical protein
MELVMNFPHPHYHRTSITTALLQSNVNRYNFEMWGSLNDICRRFPVSQRGNINMPKTDCHHHAFISFNVTKLCGMVRSWGSLLYWSS